MSACEKCWRDATFEATYSPCSQSEIRVTRWQAFDGNRGEWPENTCINPDMVLGVA